MSKEHEAISEEHKLRLADYLLKRVCEGLSGRDGAELVDMTPSRAIFAGVLSSPRQIDIEAAQQGRNSGEVPAGTSLGMDFRIIPEANKPLRLYISPRWTLYYPVFPTWEQVIQQKAIYHQGPDETTREPSQDLRDRNIDNFKTDSGNEESQVDERSTEQLILPRVFKRYNVECIPITFGVAKGKYQQISIGEEQLQVATEQACEEICNDSRLWKHLGDPRRGERSLGDSASISTAEAYESALQTVPGEKVALPPWRIFLLLEASEDTDDPRAVRIRILLANTTPERDKDLDICDIGLEERAIFDAKLTVGIEGGQLLPFDFLLAPKDYRCNPEMPSRGINCTVNWDTTTQILETETLPVFRQPLYRTKTDYEIEFSVMASDKPEKALGRIYEGMVDYLAQWDAFLKDEATNILSQDGRKACRNDRDAFKVEIDRFCLGIETLSKDRKLARAFQLMNQAFYQIGKASGGRISAWRLFQIGFIVSQLPSLAARELPASQNDEYVHRVREAFEEVGILWFPTGGGKTEAYLGLLAIAMLYDRLRGKTRGVTAWMRFPLRMLSLQQLERLAVVIAELNKLREIETDIGKGDPFAIGYYVGDSVTPNSISSDYMDRLERNVAACKEKRLLRRCPYCGNEVEVKALRKEWRLAHVCTNDKCFSHTASTLGPYRGTLPLCIVDNEIYRYLPSVLVGTVDKLAIAGRSRYFSHIMRGVRQRCRTHGYMSYGNCIEQFSARCQIRRGDIESLETVKDSVPSLLIQDELHLLRAELGAFDGHYEGLLQYLGNSSSLPSKVLAATATIEAYDVHAFHLYLSHARRYPQPSWQNGESFYATSTPLKHRRLYIGILAHTRSIEDPVIRILYLYWREIRQLQHNLQKAADVMGCPNASSIEVAHVLRLYDLSLGYVNRKATGGTLMHRAAAIEKMLETQGLGSLESRLLTGDSGPEKVGEIIARVVKEREETSESRLSQIFATNLISHGVDLERINMMVICGMPSHYAEYVQATSRAARSHPGCVFVCFKGRDPRELSQYEFFGQMHEHMDRLIEAVAINRFASFVTDKTLPGLLVGVLLNKYTPDFFGQYIDKTLDHVPTLKQALGLSPGSNATINQDELLQILEQIIGVDKDRPPASPAQIKHVQEHLAEIFNELIAAIGRTSEMKLTEVLNPLTSFRDVDEGIDFHSPECVTFLPHLGER